ncbi:MAG: hypothetical protein U0228_14830 [Myxococcaceae bacterium]
MKLWAVTMLAVLGASACGVGVDESYDGQTLVTANGQALESTAAPVGAEPAVPTEPSAPQTPTNTTPSPMKDPGQVALPQDPIPVFEGKPVGPATPPPFNPPGPMPGR